MDERVSEITAKGHQLLSKVMSGVTDINFVSVYCGDGRYTGDAWDITGMVNPRLKGEIISCKPKPAERCTKLVVRFTNETVEEFFTLREIGVYCEDPDEGNILYAYINFGEKANFIEAYNGTFYTEDEITLYIYTANVTEVKAEIVRSLAASEISFDSRDSGLAANTLQEAVDVLAERSVIIISPTEPDYWKDGDWWYEEINEAELLMPIQLGLETIPYDDAKPFHIETDGVTETVINVTDDENAATGEDLIII